MNTQLIKVIEKLKDNYKIVSFNHIGRSAIEIRVNDTIVEIIWETCSSHGARFWLNALNKHREISYAEYLEGITNPDEEFDYIVENDLLNEIEIFNNYKYLYERKVNRHTSESDYSLRETLEGCIKDLRGVDLLTLDTHLHQHPNSLVAEYYVMKSIKNGLIIIESYYLKKESEKDSYNLEDLIEDNKTVHTIKIYNKKINK